LICNSIHLENYRNIEKSTIEFSPGINILYGDNAQGKTNVIEAVYSFTKGRSFREAKDREILRWGEEWYSYEISYSDFGGDHTLAYRYYDKNRIRLYDGYKIEKLYEMIGKFRAVLFCPEHIKIVKGAPSDRRTFINVALSQLDQMYLKRLAYYDSLLENRNTLLKNKDLSDEEMLFQTSVWSKYLAETASYICIERKKYIDFLEKSVNEYMLEMTGQKEHITITYRCDIKDNDFICAENAKKIENIFYDLLVSNIQRERYMQNTLFGIHKDDYDICINENPAKIYASQGQQRSLTLALKLAEGKISKDITGDYPVFLFDDVLSELDRKRRDYILKNLKDRQIIITTCEPNSLRSIKNAHLIRVVSGKYINKR
jgi:DNA replication and repair protein RecF